MDKHKAARVASLDALTLAGDQWEKAPAHVRMMAGPYMVPVLAALAAYDEELKIIRQRLELSEAGRG